MSPLSPFITFEGFLKMSCLIVMSERVNLIVAFQMFSTFLLIVSIVGRVMPYQYQDYDAQYQDYDDVWGYSLGDDWDVSNNIAARNPYYNTWQHLSAQMEQHAFAQHMGKIYRGQLANPEINFPRHRAFGLDSDFNDGDFAYESGAFEYKSKGQQVVATQVFIGL